MEHPVRVPGPEGVGAAGGEPGRELHHLRGARDPGQRSHPLRVDELVSRRRLPRLVLHQHQPRSQEHFNSILTKSCDLFISHFLFISKHLQQKIQHARNKI